MLRRDKGFVFLTHVEGVISASKGTNGVFGGRRKVDTIRERSKITKRSHGILFWGDNYANFWVDLLT